MAGRDVGASGSRYNRCRLLRCGLGWLAGSVALAVACRGQGQSGAPAAGGRGEAAGPGAVAATQTPKRGGRFLWYVADSSNNLNAITSGPQGQFLQGVHVFDRLISFRFGMDPAREYVLEAAERVEQPDPLTVIFTLKPGLKYQERAPVNGRPVSAEDVVKTQLYVLANPRAARLFQEGSMASVQAPDARTVVFKLKAPNAYLFSANCLGHVNSQCIIPQELLDNLDTAWPVGSGPYQLVEYQLNARYLYRRWDGFREAGKGLPYLDELEIRYIPDTAAQEAAFRSEQIHVWSALPTVVDQLRRDLGPKIVIDEYLSSQVYCLWANVAKHPWRDVRAREALYRLIDRQQYLNLLEDGRGKVATGPVPPALTDYVLDARQTEQYFRQDLRAARQLLEAAGVDFNRDIEVIGVSNPRNNQGMEIFQQQASKVGLKVRPVSLPLPEWGQQRMRTGDWETSYSSLPGYETPQQIIRLQHTDPQHVWQSLGLKDPEVDRLIEKSEQTLDRNEHVKLIKDVQLALLAKYTPFIVTHSPNGYEARWAYVKNWQLEFTRQAMYRLELWLDR